MPDPPIKNKKRLSWILTALFFFALFMGPGPGIYLVNPDPGDPNAVRTFLGIPILWAWSVLWFGVEAGCVVTAYFTIWKGKAT